MATTEEKYRELSKKHTLPPFEEINNEFEVSLIEHDAFLLRSIIQRIIERMDFFSVLMESILQPDTGNLYSMHECKFFDDRQKEKVLEIYNRLMFLNRSAVELSLEKKEDKEAEFISTFMGEWKDIKKELAPIVQVMKGSWKNNILVKEELEYLG